MMSAHRIIIIELVSTGQYEAAKELILANKCDVNKKTEYGGYCAVLAAVERDDLPMLKLLVNEGKANLDIEDEFGLTPLSSAKDIKNEEMVKFIEETLAVHQKTKSAEKKQDVNHSKKMTKRLQKSDIEDSKNKINIDTDNVIHLVTK